MSAKDNINSINSEDDKPVLTRFIHRFYHSLSAVRNYKEATKNEALLAVRQFDLFLFENCPDVTEPKDISDIHMKSFKKHCNEMLKFEPASYNKKIRYLRLFFDFMIDVQKVMDANPAYRATFMPRPPDKMPGHITQFELNRVLDQLKRMPNCEADVAITLFISELGFRVHEAINIEMDKLARDLTFITISRDDKTLRFPLTPDLSQALQLYLNVRRNSASATGGPIFISKTGNGYSSRSYHYKFKNAICALDMPNYTPRHIRALFMLKATSIVPPEELCKISTQTKVQHYYDFSANSLFEKKGGKQYV